MTLQKKTRLLAKVGVTAAATIGLALTIQPLASAATPSVSVTPSTDLADGATVTVDAANFTPNSTAYAGECTDISPSEMVCNGTGPGVQVDIGADGTGSTQITVNRSFDGFLVGGGHYGTIDCTVSSCYVVAGNQTEGWAAPISFS